MRASPHIESCRASRRTRRAGSALAGATLGLVACALALPGGASAEGASGELDVEPPLIEHEVLAEAASGARQSFVAQVVDDRELESVRLHWRRAGETGFEALAMTRVSRSSTWIAQVPTEPEDPRAIEYWIEARDAGGNRTVRGFAFSPLVRRVAVPRDTRAGGPGRPRDARAPTPTPSGDGEPGGRNVLWVVLGALGAALVLGVALSGGGGGGTPSPGTGCGPDGCDVTITFDPPLSP